MATSGDVCFLRVKEVRVRGAAPEGTCCSQSSLVFKVKENTSTPEMIAEQELWFLFLYCLRVGGGREEIH